ncbi:FprA family A-type flavoprotein [Clostridium weizhouense]|uniref:FprA family A-type flavoprotein n=1 Tax=Clostridium weizhouense TaxID=2859781 RepID=A0ABS7AT76_9CLOT|nr:FprA family A-type flavoprotein [Clostridium weizhouense]MBW6411626.1 FprA family A-type flavoprotein [Clostridium weizhouense]
MYCVRKVKDDLYWVGGNDRHITLFENIHPVPRGISYNSYILLDEKNILLDTVDWSIASQFIQNIEEVLKDKELDYMIVNHVEPDHSGCIEEIINRYPNIKIICTQKAHMFMEQFGFCINDKIIEVKDGDEMSFGKHKLRFLTAPMVHWPEAMVTYDTINGVLFSADAFGTFISLDGKLFNDEINFEKEWIDEARRYYANIVGKYGINVQTLLKKVSNLDVKCICPLHGPVWHNNLNYFIDKYDKWSKYEAEEKGVLIAYGTMYGNTESAANCLATKLVEKGINNIVMYDVSRTHVSYLISETFKYSHIVLACATYNLNIYPPMLNYLLDMKELNLQKRTFGIIENGTWASKAGKLMRDLLNEMKDMVVLDEDVSLKTVLKQEEVNCIEKLADSIISSMN